MDVVLKKWGNGQGIRLSQELIKELKWNVNDTIEMNVVSDKLVLQRKEQPKTVRELFDNNSSTAGIAEFDFGYPEGEEIW